MFFIYSLPLASSCSSMSLLGPSWSVEEMDKGIIPFTDNTNNPISLFVHLLFFIKRLTNLSELTLKFV